MTDAERAQLARLTDDDVVEKATEAAWDFSFAGTFSTWAAFGDQRKKDHCRDQMRTALTAAQAALSGEEVRP